MIDHLTPRDKTRKRLAEQWGSKPNNPWIEECSFLDFLSPGLKASRQFIAASQFQTDEGQLISAACKESLLPEHFAGTTDIALGVYPKNGSPIWPALARHLVRRATNQDKEILIEAARKPEQWPSPLNWGLQYIVRGDLMLEDGTEIQLDDLARMEGLEPLPYLEDAAPLPNATSECTQKFLLKPNLLIITNPNK